MLSYSIITICLNSEKTIQKTIDSVMKQQPLANEYIFVDGGSSDATLNTIHDLEKMVVEKSLPVNIKLLLQSEKTGIYGAMNLGLKAVTADLVFILNSDDWYEKDTAAVVLDEFAKSSDVDIVYASAYFHKENGLRFIRTPRSFVLLPFLMPIAHPATFIKHSVYDKLGIFNETYSLSADYDFIYRCSDAGVKFCEIRKPLVNMLLGGAANSGRAKAREETYHIAKKYCCCKILPFFAYFARKMLNR
jgi:glycosyltransferase involved in cell wall biosynthesis